MREALEAVGGRSSIVPRVAIVAGSGLSGISERVQDPTTIPYGSIPGWPPSTVGGHAGELVLGHLGDTPVAVARGRCHLYEGYTAVEVTFGVRLLHALGARTLIVTNAAGGLNPEYRPGDIMVIVDHVFLPGMAGPNPLIGPNDDAIGPRFPGMWNAYDPRLQRVAEDALISAGLHHRRGVYAMVVGPSFETPAEARALRVLGADAVGMSTAPEVVVGRHRGMRVLGLSLITNRVRLEPPSLDEDGLADLHEEVTEVGVAAAGPLARAIAQVCRTL